MALVPNQYSPLGSMKARFRGSGAMSIVYFPIAEATKVKMNSRMKMTDMISAGRFLIKLAQTLFQ
jgi:hypothetical protein